MHPHSSLARLGAALFVLLLASVRCQVGLDVQPLQRFDNCEELEAYLHDQILHPGVEQSFANSGALEGCASSLLDVAAPGAAGEGEGEARQFTTTNTQELDVDEPDFVKNNGDVIFVLRRGEMIILKAWPADDMAVLSRTAIAGTPFTMVFNDVEKRALVIASFFGAGKAQVLAKLFDVSNAAAPVELRSTLIDGDFVDARGVGDQVMLVTRSQLAVNVELDFAPFSDDENRARLRAAGLTRLLPQVSDFIAGDAEPNVERAVGCENTYAPSVSDGRNILLVHGFNLSDATAPLRSTGVVAGFSHVYGSASALYLAATEFQDGGYFTDSFATTRIHKLNAFEGAGAAEYQATGLFTGSIKDELSLDEGPDGSLRVVITDDSPSDLALAQATSLLVLEQQGTDLVEVARVDDIGRGENVESVRFIGDKAYIVTYPADQFLEIDSRTALPRMPFTDPLFIVDLKDPQEPHLRGELKVDGYSAYIHPLDENHLLTVGVNTAPETGALLGLSLLIFDVTDPDAPSLLHRHDFGDENTGSEALVERHAFTYFAAQAALAIPVQRFSPLGLLESSALAVFHVDIEDGFTPLGQIEQAPLYQNIDGLQQVDVNVGPCASVRRAVMISTDSEASVYAISSAGLTAAAIENGLPTKANLRFGAIDDVICPERSGEPL